jgi:hypothetical protein
LPGPESEKYIISFDSLEAAIGWQAPQYLIDPPERMNVSTTTKRKAWKEEGAMRMAPSSFQAQNPGRAKPAIA